MASTHDRIVESFAKHYDAGGYRATSVEDIARDLRISKKTVYVHFESKESIFREMLRLRAEEERSRIAALLADRETYRDRIGGLVGVVSAFARDWWERNRDTELVEWVEVGEKVFLEAYTELIREYVREGVAAGEFRVEDADIAARFVGGIMLSGTRMIQEDSAAVPEPHVVEAVERLLTC